MTQPVVRSRLCCAGQFERQRQTVGGAASEAEGKAQRQAEPRSENHSVGNAAGESTKRTVYAAQDVIGKVQSPEDVEKTADDTDRGQLVTVDRRHYNKGLIE